MDDLAGCDVSLGAWPRLPTLPPPLKQFAESPKRLGAGRAWLWRAALALLVLIPLLAEFPQAAAQSVPTLTVKIPTVTEGETGIVKLTLSQPSSQAIDVTVGESSVICGTSITCPQGTDAAGSNDFSRISETITFDAGDTEKTVSFTATDDSMSEMTELFFFVVGDLLTSEATIDPDTPPDISFPSQFWLVRIQDNDNPANPNVTIAPGTSPVTEGAAATFTVTATPAPTAATTVSVAVTEETSGGQDFVALSNETTHTVSIPASGSQGAGTATLTIPTVGDTTQELHGAVTATVDTGTGYTVGNPSSATVTVYDDDTPLPTGPEVSVRLMVGEGENRNADGEVEKPESDATVSFPLSLDAQPAADMTVRVDVSSSGDVDRVASADEGIKTVSFLAGVQSGSIDVAWTDTNADDLDSVITVTAVVSSTAGCSSTDTYTVSSAHGSDKVRITDDEVTGVSLASTDMELGEGDTSNTAVMTVSLGRALISGESVVARITLATSTGARLPGHATPDFAVTATGTGVVLSNQTSATPLLTFTGSDSNTVQTATVTLTPIATSDDGDSADEELTATLSLLTGTGSGTVVTGGGVEIEQASSVVTLSIDDDEAAPAACSAQNTIFSDTNLRILENEGVATYCVRLLTAPSGGDTVVTLGRDGGNRFAANFSPATLTFTASDYMTPQQVTVTGADEPGTHRNRPDMRLTHTANGGGYSSQALGSVRLEVDDAPEVEAFWYMQGDGRIRRPHTVTSTLGLTAWQNAAPGDRINYAVRLSNRPEPGGTVTVTVTVPSDKRNLVGLSLTEGGAAQDTVTVEFKDRSPGAGTGCSNWFGHQPHEYFDSNGIERRVSGRQPGESYDATPDTPWECSRMIYVVRKPSSRNIDDTCADITHTATGGGVRMVTVDTIRAHVLNPGRNKRGSSGQASQCRNLHGNTVNSPALAAPAPTESVANVQVTAVDDASVSVTWDAVEHATSYEVSWSAESSDSVTAIAGTLPSVTSTSSPIQHDASERMTLTVTVTPEYVDKNGDTQQLSNLAGTATLDVGPVGQDAQAESVQAIVTPPPDCVSDTLLNKVRHYYDINKHRAPGYGQNWRRVLLAFGDLSDANLTPFTATDARVRESRWFGWKPVRVALECIEAG